MKNRRFRTSAMFIALTLVAAACGGDDDDDDAAGAGSGTTAPGQDTVPFEGISYDESAQCGVDPYTGNLATVEAVDELTVRFTLCQPDVAFPSKVAFSAFGIQSSDYLDETGGGADLVEAPVGTGPYRLEAWERGSQMVMARNDDYWGEAPPFETVVFRWSEEAAQRLNELQSGTVDGIDNVGTDDFSTVQGDDELQLIERDPLNVFYVGFNVDMEPFTDERVRQAVGHAIDRERVVENFYPAGSEAASQFLPPAIAGYVEGFDGIAYDPDLARDLLEQAGFADGFEVDLSYRDVVRGYLPQPTQVATDIQAQLAEVGIRVNLDLQESGTFIDNTNAGNTPFYLLGWGADYPDATNFLDFHFGAGASPQFGPGFDDIHEVLSEAASLTDEEERNALYADAADLLVERVPMVPVAYGGSAVAYKATVDGGHASPLSNESMAALSIEGQDQFTWLQNAEPLGLYCADETDGESLRACEQINESLLAYEVGGTEVIPSLAEDYESNDELTEWTFTLREGVTFHDGGALDANDVVETYRVQWDFEDERHVGRVGDFVYFSALFGGYLNPPPAEE